MELYAFAPAGRPAGHRASREAWSGLSELKDGIRITAETARRLSYGAARVVVRTNADGTIIDAGRRTRTIPPATRRALEARDRGCRFPDHSSATSGARGLRFTDGHHIVHWADGGETRLENLVLLCARHHRRVHEGAYQVCPVQELVQGNRDRGVVPDEWASAPHWHRDSAIPWAIEAAAREALDSCDDEDESAERVTRLPR